jgi:hypothetical protein
MTAGTGGRLEILQHKGGETMKSRKVVIVIEAKTDMPLKELRSIWSAIPDADYWHDCGCEFEVRKITVKRGKEGR